MRFANQFALAGLLAVILLFSARGVQASENGPLRKLGRGVSNIAFGVCEVPLQVWNVNREEGGLAAYTYGVFKGLAYFLAREGVGVAEFVTFPMPLPGCTEYPEETGWGYAPIIEPEWIFTPDRNPYDIIYQDFPPD